MFPWRACRVEAAGDVAPLGVDGLAVRRVTGCGALANAPDTDEPTFLADMIVRAVPAESRLWPSERRPTSGGVTCLCLMARFLGRWSTRHDGLASARVRPWAE